VLLSKAEGNYNFKETVQNNMRAFIVQLLPAGIVIKTGFETMLETQIQAVSEMFFVCLFRRRVS